MTPPTDRPPTRPPPLPDVRTLPKGLREFLRTEAAGGIFLLVGALVALAWANSAWRASYDTLWSSDVDLRIGSVGFHGDLRLFVNEALMAVFFFVVGLEIKRELVAGELRTWRTAALPAIAAFGGMVVPAVLYTAFNFSGDGAAGWGVPMATDIAFAVGVLALFGSRVPSSLKLFLLTLAIVDDVGAIAVIAVFYTDVVHLDALAAAASVLILMGLMRWQKVNWMPLYFACGVVVWLAVHESGVHATIAGVVLGLLAPARPLTPRAVAAEWAHDLAADPAPGDLRAMATLARSSVSVAERLEHDLHPVSSFVIVPLFALANAGVRLEAAALDSSAARLVAVGVVVGLVVGKLAGISLFAWLAVRSGLGRLPDGATWLQLVGVAAIAGIGFTVSLFIT
ncbi:MAG: Na+/H+ antiporter NhaA, partial [Acidimicrobiales bacterium]